MALDADSGRSIGLWGATSIGVGAIVGGGILALAGVAFSATGPSALVAFSLNGLIAALTALSFAELSSRFPQSGGTYLFAKKVLSVEAAFAVGWVVWFASIAAGALYALGFGYFATVAIDHWYLAAYDHSPAWLAQWPALRLLGLAAIAYYTWRLTWKAGGGAGHWENAGKLLVFALLIGAGFWTLTGRPAQSIQTSLTPFFSAGALGLVQAMGFTFIALQGFDLIAAAGGEIRHPARTIPRSMFLSLAIAMVVYLPLLLVVATAGVEPGDSIVAASKKDPEGVIAVAAEQFLGPAGYWLVVVAALLSMLSALRANLFAASRVAASMARDRTMPHAMSVFHARRNTPVVAVLATSGLVAAMVVGLPGVAAAGAASSLIFLVTFALAHWIAILARLRSPGRPPPFRIAWFPLAPAVGAVACLALAIFQGTAVPSAGVITTVWLCLGGLLFLGLFARSARVVDAVSEARDPEVIRLRGRTPLVLVPIANPNNAEALVTVAANPWEEISRIAREHRCESIVMGLSEFQENATATPLADLLAEVACDVVVLRSTPGWTLSQVREILVPVGGQGWHDVLRARLLGNLFRMGERQVTLLQILPENAPEAACTRARRALAGIARDEASRFSRVKVVQSDAVGRVIVEHAAQSDLVILGVQRFSARKKAFGHISQQIARDTKCPILMISHRG